MSKLAAIILAPIVIPLLGVWYIGQCIFYIALTLAVFSVAVVVFFAWYFSLVFVFLEGLLLERSS